MDNVLVAYLTAGDDGKRQQYLDELLTVSATPLIRQVLRRRLGFYVNAYGANENNQDAEDLYQEAMTRVVQVLRQLQSSSGNDIEDFELYVSRIASNICTDFLRAKSPARTRLKYSLRDLLKQHNELVSWKHNHEILCGFARWRNTSRSTFSDQSFEDIQTKLDHFQLLHFADEDIGAAPVPQIVAELFNWIGGPVDIDLLVRMIGYLLDIKDQQFESLDDPASVKRDVYFTANVRSGDSHVEAHELLTHLWQAVIQLPAEQRDSFALSFEDQAGQDLFTLLLTADIVSWDELARGMGRTVDEVVQLRVQMPMESVKVAHELRASRENVYKWRFRAMRRLEIALRAQKIIR
jgi:RNA polymerase sigma factor (sigma-70 family)